MANIQNIDLGPAKDHYNVEHDPDDLWGDSRVIMNIGPTHPAMHGALRMVAKLNGETIEKSYCEFGFTHRAKEKLGENRTYHQFVVYTDRLNYCSALINNVTYAMAVERLMGIQVPNSCILGSPLSKRRLRPRCAEARFYFR